MTRVATLSVRILTLFSSVHFSSIHFRLGISSHEQFSVLIFFRLFFRVYIFSSSLIFVHAFFSSIHFGVCHFFVHLYLFLYMQFFYRTFSSTHFLVSVFFVRSFFRPTFPSVHPFFVQIIESWIPSIFPFQVIFWTLGKPEAQGVF